MTTDHQYKIADLPQGQRGQEIVEITADAQASVLWLPPDIPSETKFDFVQALNRAFDAGRQSARDEPQASPSPAMAERAARLLLTRAGVLPEVHTALGQPPRPLCGNPDGFGPGGYATASMLEVTCQGCLDKHGITEDQHAEYERWAQEGPPADQCVPSAQVLAEVGP